MLLHRCHNTWKSCNFASKNRLEQIMRYTLLILLGWLLVMVGLSAQDLQCLRLPNQELLSSDRVLFLMEDGEGCLWYATERGGVCRDDGRQVDVFRSDADHPDILAAEERAELITRHDAVGDEDMLAQHGPLRAYELFSTMASSLGHSSRWERQVS